MPTRTPRTEGNNGDVFTLKEDYVPSPLSHTGRVLEPEFLISSLSLASSSDTLRPVQHPKSGVVYRLSFRVFTAASGVRLPAPELFESRTRSRLFAGDGFGRCCRAAEGGDSNVSEARGRALLVSRWKLLFV